MKVVHLYTIIALLTSLVISFFIFSFHRKVEGLKSAQNSFIGQVTILNEKIFSQSVNSRSSDILKQIDGEYSNSSFGLETTEAGFRISNQIELAKSFPSYYLSNHDLEFNTDTVKRKLVQSFLDITEKEYVEAAGPLLELANEDMALSYVLCGLISPFIDSVDFNAISDNVYFVFGQNEGLNLKNSPGSLPSLHILLEKAQQNKKLADCYNCIFDKENDCQSECDL